MVDIQDGEIKRAIKKEHKSSSTYKEAMQELKLDKDRMNVQHVKDSYKLSEDFSKRIFWLVVGFLAVVFLFVGLEDYLSHGLSDRVLITLLATTTIEVIGLLYVTAKCILDHRITKK